MTKAGSLPDRFLMITYCAVKGLATWVFTAVLGLTADVSFGGRLQQSGPEQIKQMPQGGRYSVFAMSQKSASNLRTLRVRQNFSFSLSQASPSFCSGQRIWYSSGRSRLARARSTTARLFQR